MWQGKWIRTSGLGIVAVALALTAGMVLGSPLQPASTEAAPAEVLAEYVRVNGQGKVTVKPDEALLNLGVQTRGKEARQAMDENAKLMQQVIDAVKKQGIEESQIQTAGYHVNEEYEWRKDAQGERNEVVGYTAVNHVRVTVNQLDKVGALIDAASAAGANQIGGIQFHMSDAAVRQHEGEALRLAIQHAKSKGDAIAEGTGRSLGKLLSVDEMGGSQPPVIYREAQRAMMEKSAADTPIQPGEMDFELQVTVTYQLN